MTPVREAPRYRWGIEVLLEERAHPCVYANGIEHGGQPGRRRGQTLLVRSDRGAADDRPRAALLDRRRPTQP
ncbi:hypothetical protein GS575_27940 [Rhodococcus hoagii]|nr:hypothetical protein [Prescottella equi]